MTNNLGMTSQEAAALYLSDGQTDDPGLASMLDYAKKQPELLVPRGTIGEVKYKPAEITLPEDPDAVERKRLRDALGFDFDVVIDGSHVTLTDKEYPLHVKCKLTGKDDGLEDAVTLSNATIKLKKKHDKHVKSLA